jgi:hypothetical protein
MVIAELEIADSYRRMMRRNLTLSAIAASTGIFIVDLLSDLSNASGGSRSILQLVIFRVLFGIVVLLLCVIIMSALWTFLYKNARISVDGDTIVLRGAPTAKFKIPDGDESIWIRQHRSGKWWILGSTAQPGRKIRVPMRAYPTLDVFLREALTDKSFSRLCTGCGYNLRASAGSCPECGGNIPGSAI